ncbi:sulfurtransferase complex subunit TusD [Seongchinamella sediminis]|uniref:Sulfurtransferase complex subunit TusD n=1 Tax=Seongchinamella sediminis TaxID=2283635 RepID=A0A3L7E237_9GAMM|nr:sulfurtransferase complex subunit TusD [Seongchinamella sediminis]RLQ23059.1 sulfurtransferase complex subunit TusD [Seongchinamella sediminis]
MNYALLVMSSPASGHGARTAARFAAGAIARGHTIERVFFLDEGVGTGSGVAVFPQDEDDRLAPWIELAEQHEVELVLCISSALKRGMLDAAEARRHGRAGPTAHPAFVVSGLGQLIDAAASADRLLTFGG